MAYPFKALTGAFLFSVMATAPSLAQSTMSDYTRPYGQNAAQAGSAYSGTNSAGNRVIVNGIMQTGVGVSPQINAMNGMNLNVAGTTGTGTQTGSQYAPAYATAIGNQLNVNVTGNYNTVIVNSSQVNNGDVSATASTDQNTETSHDED